MLRRLTRAAPALTAGRLRASGAVAGRRFDVTLPVTSTYDKAVTSLAVVACTARIGGRVLPVLRRTFAGNRARCAWLLPATASGKTVHAEVVVRVAQAIVSKKLARRIS
jgi:hypothetical protein